MNGVISDEARDVFIDLVAMENVPANRVTSVFKRIASVFGIEVEGEVSDRSIGRILKEGGNASKLHYKTQVTVKQGVTISGDGTTHKNETYESKFATVITPEKRIQFFLGIKMAVNHTSETQLAGWIESIEEFFNLAYDSKLVSVNDTRIFWNLVTGFHSDHAADQRKLFDLMKKWKKQLDRETRGERTIQGLSDNEYACLVFQGSQLLIQNSGGPASWERLTLEERTCRIANMKKQLVRDIGEVEFQKLSASEQSEIDLFLWAGCCMHKEMNAFKGGCIGLDDFWDEHTELTSPIPLPNRDNAATIRLASGTAAAARAKGRTERGAVKLASLAGMIFRHKDRKRGQQDTLRFFFDYKIGFSLAFTDTSNTRFQSHAEACALIVTHLDLFIEFLTYVRYNKGSGALNHMEQNVLNGLQDMATRHELCTITLYWLAISIPYMREVRGPNAKQDNILKLEGLHRRVIEHIDTLIVYPEYIIGPDASCAKGSLDGLNWERPDTFYAVQSYAPGLPHLKPIFVYFLKKARVVWLRFMSEFEEGSALSSATPEQIDRAFMEKTNDLNESAFGIYRQSSRRNPTMSITQHNSRQMYKFNQTSTFLHSLTPELRQWLRKITREQDNSGANRQEKLKLAAYRKHVADTRVENQQILNERRQAAIQAIDSITPILTLTAFDYHASLPQGSKEYLTVGELTKQLKWHKKNGREGCVPSVESSWGRREDKLKLLRSVIEEHVTHEASQTGLRDIPEEGEPNEGVPDITPEDLECFQEDGYNSEEEFYGR
ncbi:hypothetical protein F5878DRAFT_571952 [Lentinula raphanica]|uniref:Uncharacterized protein n=1 Tax=Lentinula raphanica TaxID=153919 RepID=A0AA38ULK4_9AGAR|nr:hypothetical protein F5878DRAFT_571952 [Lentinula raphanica]